MFGSYKMFVNTDIYEKLNNTKWSIEKNTLSLCDYQYHLEKISRTVERYPEAYRFANEQHNLNIWTFDKAIIGTTLGDWDISLNKEEELEILSFVYIEKNKTNVKLGDFFEFTTFLKEIIGMDKEG